MSTVSTDRQARIESLEAELATLKSAAKAELEALRQSVTPVYQYFIGLDQRASMDKIFDESVVLYRIVGVCSNKEDVEAVGGGLNLHEGEMSYLFNLATGKIIKSDGGGRIFISDGRFTSRNEIDDSHQAFTELSAFLVRYPAGGEITHLIEAHQERRKAPQV